MLAPRLAGSGRMQPVCRRREELVVGLRCGFPKLLSEVLGRCTTFVSTKHLSDSFTRWLHPACTHPTSSTSDQHSGSAVLVPDNVYNLRISPKAASGLLEYCFTPNAEFP